MTNKRKGTNLTIKLLIALLIIIIAIIGVLLLFNYTDSDSYDKPKRNSVDKGNDVEIVSIQSGKKIIKIHTSNSKADADSDNISYHPKEDTLFNNIVVDSNNQNTRSNYQVQKKKNNRENHRPNLQSQGQDNNDEDENSNSQSQGQDNNDEDENSNSQSQRQNNNNEENDNSNSQNQRQDNNREHSDSNSQSQDEDDNNRENNEDEAEDNKSSSQTQNEDNNNGENNEPTTQRERGHPHGHNFHSPVEDEEHQESTTQTQRERGNPSLGYLSGRLSGLSTGTQGRVILSSQSDNSFLETAQIEEDGSFEISKDGMEDNKKYSLKAEIQGYKLSPISDITTETKEVTGEVETIQEDNVFRYNWKQETSTSGLEYSSHVNTPVVIEYLDEDKELPPFDTAEKLYEDYGVVLDGDEWTGEHAFRLYETMKQVPSKKKEDSRWILVNKEVEDDIEIEETSDETVVRISSSAFANAEPKIVRIDGQKGRFFSKRLHHAVVRYVTDNGEDEDATEKILTERFGVSINIPDSKYPQITTPTGGEHHDRFQKFSPTETLMLINQMEEMPEGFHKTPQLKYMLRRANGQKHPLYPEAAAVAWTQSGYIEFMESAFTSELEHTQKLIIHEKTHFLWAHTFSKELKREWADIGGWTPDKDPDDYDGWSTTKTTEFVTAYSHGISPNEDMVESVSFYLYNPEKLRAVSPEKYEFIEKRIMHGTRYYTHIREDLTFEVHNLDPDYVYPGKIKEIDITVSGAPDEDKRVKVIVKLHKEDASLGFMRITSPIGTYKDVYLYPRGGKTSTILEASFTIEKEAKEGYWKANQISLEDEVGNRRYQDSSTYGWSMYINNSGEDTTPPKYVKNSIELEKESGLYKIVDGKIKKTSCDERSQTCRFATFVTAKWDVIEDRKMGEWSECYIAFRKDNNREYSVQEYGAYTLHESPNSTGKCSVTLTFNEFRYGTFLVASISMEDRAGNRGSVDFNRDNIHEEPLTIDIEEITPDTKPPRLYQEVGDIEVNAESSNPENPNGRTLVTVSYYAEDDLSGLDTVYIKMRDPQGKTHGNYHYHNNFYTDYFIGDPTEKKQYTFTTTLPEGSAPGTWGITLITLYDKAGNKKDYDFTETMIFEVIEEGES